MNNTGESSITIKGEVIPLYYGLKADEYFSIEWAKDANNEIMDEAGNITELGIAMLVYSGYIHQCKLNRIAPKYALSHFYKHMDECRVNEDAGKNLLDSMSDWKRSKYSLAALKIIISQNKLQEDTEDVKKNT